MLHKAAAPPLHPHRVHQQQASLSGSHERVGTGGDLGRAHAPSNADSPAQDEAADDEADDEIWHSGVELRYEHAR